MGKVCAEKYNDKKKHTHNAKNKMQCSAGEKKSVLIKNGHFQFMFLSRYACVCLCGKIKISSSKSERARAIRCDFYLYAFAFFATAAVVVVVNLLHGIGGPLAPMCTHCTGYKINNAAKHQQEKKRKEKNPCKTFIKFSKICEPLVIADKAFYVFAFNLLFSSAVLSYSAYVGFGFSKCLCAHCACQHSWCVCVWSVPNVCVMSQRGISCNFGMSNGPYKIDGEGEQRKYTLKKRKTHRNMTQVVCVFLFFH